MDQATFNELFREPRWYRWVDAAVVLVIGALMGATITCGVILFQNEQANRYVPASSTTDALPQGARFDSV
jgi:hypothetical protein